MSAKTVKDIMTSEVEWVSPDTRLTEIAERMDECDCGSVLIGEDDQLVGVVTDRDIVLRAVAKGLDIKETTAKDVMSEKVLYCRQSDSIEDVARNMAKAQVRRLAVLDDNKRLVGIVSLGDIAVASSQATGSAMSEICREATQKAA